MHLFLPVRACALLRSHKFLYIRHLTAHEYGRSLNVHKNGVVKMRAPDVALTMDPILQNPKSQKCIGRGSCNVPL